MLTVAIAVMAVDFGMSFSGEERLEVGGVRVIFLCFAVEAAAIIFALVADHR